MTELDPKLAAPKGDAATQSSHSHPIFEDKQSRRHQRSPIWRFRLRAEYLGIANRKVLSQLDTMVIFVGYPRSGHSLIGSILDGHREAVVSHELDAMGLFYKGIPATKLPCLMAWNSNQFTKSGRWWNGFCYDIQSGTHGLRGSAAPKVIGDKKGDWAVRWSALDPDLPKRLSGQCSLRCIWVLVTRHPLDNIATLSLRKGGTYDRLRIAHSSEDFREALKKAQTEGQIAHHARDDMIDDWRAMTSSVAQMKSIVPASNWHEIVYEDFVDNPDKQCRLLTQKLGLEPDENWLKKGAKTVKPSSRLSRNSVKWSKAQLENVTHSIQAHDFLASYADDI